MVCEVDGDFAPDQYQSQVSNRYTVDLDHFYRQKTDISLSLEPLWSNGVTYCIDEDGNKIAETLKWDNAQVGSRFEECDAYRYWFNV